MSASEFGEVLRAAKLLANYSKPWAVCGGWAIDLYLNRVTRSHKDVDFTVLRRDQLDIQEYLLSHSWSLEKAVSGQLIPWQPGEWINLPIHVIWCKNPNTFPDFIELLFNEVDEVSFHFRRNTSIMLPVETMIIPAMSGIPILAPEIVLLYKSVKAEDPAAAADFKNVLPKLSLDRRNWLAAALRKLYSDHVWLEDLSPAEKGSL
jgi:hypothetical protein